MNKQCAECRNGEHDNYDNNICLTVVRDPDTNRIVMRAYLCEEHRESKMDDVYGINGTLM